MAGAFLFVAMESKNRLSGQMSSDFGVPWTRGEAVCNPWLGGLPTNRSFRFPHLGFKRSS